MTRAKISGWRSIILLLACAVPPCMAADHNDPNAINSIFSDVAVSPADLYDLFGFPGSSAAGEERVVLALTFAAVPRTGELDPDLLYRVRLYTTPRAVRPMDGADLDALINYAKAAREKYLHAPAAEVRVQPLSGGRAKLDFIGFAGGPLSVTAALNRTLELKTAAGKVIQIYVGGRDDAFFNDLPGFFRSINYAPQFYHVPHAMKQMRELPIPKTLIELEDNTLFNFNPAHPLLGQGEKANLPAGPLRWTGKRFFKDSEGRYRFAYSGKDAQAGRNVNAIILELPLSYITKSPAQERIVNVWGESWVLKAANKIELIADDDTCCFRGLWAWVTGLFGATPSPFDTQLEKYKRVDTDGVPFADAGLNEREDDRQLGADNESLARHFVLRLAHLGAGFGPSITALGLGTCFDHGNATVSQHKMYDLAINAFPPAKKCLFQQVNMPDDTWQVRRKDIPLKRPFEIFIPNVCAIDMDTNGTWPYGRRLEDQVANRFLSIFLDMKAGCGGRMCNVETLSDQALWDAAPIEPKTSPNPLHNDVPFLDRFPYMAEPHPGK
jgi:Domain of unknown function (DUF4331)